MPKRPEDTPPIADSPQNLIAGRALRRARDLIEVNQEDFGKAIGQRLRVAAYGQSAVSDWETGNRQVPAAALIAAAEVARVDPCELFSTAAGRRYP